MYGIVRHLSIDGSTSYFAQPQTDDCLQEGEMTLSSIFTCFNNVTPALVTLWLDTNRPYQMFS